MRSQFLIAAVLLSALACCPAVGQDSTVMITEPRPLGALSLKLAALGYAVTYEEAPYDQGDLASESRPAGKRFLYPKSRPVTFHLASGNSDSDARVGDPVPEHSLHKPLDKPALLHMVQEYNDSGNPGRFAVVFEGDYAHILPSSRIVDGKMVAFQPILSTPVQMPPVPTSCMTALQDLIRSIQTSREANIVLGIVPTGSLIQTQCAIFGDHLSARDVLIQILRQASTCCTHQAPRIPTWVLYHDANWNQYWLSTRWVPNQAWPGTGAIPDPSTGAASGTPGALKGHVAVPIKQP